MGRGAVPSSLLCQATPCLLVQLHSKKKTAQNHPHSISGKKCGASLVLGGYLCCLSVLSFLLLLPFLLDQSH